MQRVNPRPRPTLVAARLARQVVRPGRLGAPALVLFGLACGCAAPRATDPGRATPVEPTYSPPALAGARQFDASAANEAATAARPRETPRETPAATEAASDLAPAEPASAVYHSPFGFRFTAPAAWAGGYRIEELPSEVAADLGALSVVRFLFMPDDAARTPMPLVSLVALTETGLAALESQGGPPPGIVVQTCGDTVILATTPSGNPYGATADGRRFEQLYLALNLRESVSCEDEE